MDQSGGEDGGGSPRKVEWRSRMVALVVVEGQAEVGGWSLLEVEVEVGALAPGESV